MSQNDFFDFISQFMSILGGLSQLTMLILFIGLFIYKIVLFVNRASQIENIQNQSPVGGSLPNRL